VKRRNTASQNTSVASTDDPRTQSFDSSRQPKYLSPPKSSHHHLSQHNLDPTPSLCSDTGDPVEDERLPPTPRLTQEVALVPLLEPQVPNAPQGTIPRNIPSRIPTRLRSVIPRLQQRKQDNSVDLSTSDGFASRSIANPVLGQLSPQKPKPPGRTRKTPTKALSSRVLFDKDQTDAVIPGENLLLPLEDVDNGSTHLPGTTGDNVGSLEAELRRIARRDVEAEYQRELHDLAEQAGSLLVDVGQVNSRDVGFMAGGGAGGLPVWMGNADEAFNSDESEKSEVTGRHAVSQSFHYIP